MHILGLYICNSFNIMEAKMLSGVKSGRIRVFLEVKMAGYKYPAASNLITMNFPRFVYLLLS
jgi:hypothetical protein